MTAIKLAAATILIIGPSVPAYAQEARVGQITIRVNCMTDHTAWDGARRHCNDGDTYTAPPGFVIDQQSIRRVVNSENGSEHWCRHEFSDFRPLVPNLPITQPGKVTIAAHARSPTGSFSGRGWIDCSFTMTQVDIPKLTADQQALVSELTSAEEEFSSAEEELPTEEEVFAEAEQDNNGTSDIEFREFNMNSQ